MTTWGGIARWNSLRTWGALSLLTLADIAARVTPLGDAAYGNAWVVLTQAEYDLLLADASRTDVIPNTIYRPDGTIARRGATRGVAAFLGSPVVVREVGADITDLSGSVLDLRNA